MSKVPEEPKMNDVKSEPRFCLVKATHTAQRLLESDADHSGFGMTAHCKSPSCNWCLPCFVARTQRRSS